MFTTWKSMETKQYSLVQRLHKQGQIQGGLIPWEIHCCAPIQANWKLVCEVSFLQRAQIRLS